MTTKRTPHIPKTIFQETMERLDILAHKVNEIAENQEQIIALLAHATGAVWVTQAEADEINKQQKAAADDEKDGDQANVH